MSVGMILGRGKIVNEKLLLEGNCGNDNSLLLEECLVFLTKTMSALLDTQVFRYGVKHFISV